MARGIVVPARRWAGRIVRWLVISYLVLMAAFVVVFRSKSPRLLDAVRAFNKRILNPAMLRLAGGRHWYAARVEHVGRRSGRRYATPVVAIPTPDGFVIPLPYGVDVDWCRNLRAAGGGVVEEAGVRYDVGDPAIIDAAAALPLLPPRARRQFGLYGVEHYLTVTARRAADAAPGIDAMGAGRVRAGSVAARR